MRYANVQNLIHAWAHEGTPGKAASVFFEEDGTLYSYGRHFPLALRLRPGQFLINPANYSRTTSKHQSWTRSAVHGDTITAPVEEWDALRVLSFSDFREEATRRREAAEHEARIREEEREARRLARLDPSPEAVAKRERARARRVELERRKLADTLAAWRNGKTVPNWRETLRASNVQFLRINGDQIETTGGATVPLEFAPLIWRKLSALAATETGDPDFRFGALYRGLSWVQTGDTKVGAAGLCARIGCHLIPFSEFELLAEQLELIDRPATVA